MSSSTGICSCQRSVESRPADLRQLTHPLDTQAALHRHHSPDLVVDAVSPEFAAVLASSLDFLQGTFEKIHFQCLLRQQPLQLVFSLRACIHADVLRRRSRRPRSDPADRATCTAAADERPVPPTAPRCCRSPSSAPPPSAGMPSDIVPFVVFATRSSFPCKVCQLRVSHFRGSVHDITCDSRGSTLPTR